MAQAEENVSGCSFSSEPVARGVPLGAEHWKARMAGRLGSQATVRPRRRSPKKLIRSSRYLLPLARRTRVEELFLGAITILFSPGVYGHIEARPPLLTSTDWPISRLASCTHETTQLLP